MSIEFVVHPIRWEACPMAAADRYARSWITFQSHRGLARNTLEAYSAGLDRYLRYLAKSGTSAVRATRADVGAYLSELQMSTSRLSNATLQQLLTIVRLYQTYLVEEGVRTDNPASAGQRNRPLISRYHRLPWIPNQDDWQSFLEEARHEPIRNRLMFALAYDAGLRREELCSLRSDDIDPSKRTLRIRAETSKGRRERIVPYSASSGTMLQQYLEHRAKLGGGRGALFLSESLRNCAEAISIWTWSKVVRSVAVRANANGFSTHTLRHLCLTDLARAGWDIHEIAAFAGHRSIQTTLLYIHLSGRDLSQKLANGMAQIHASRVKLLAEMRL